MLVGHGSEVIKHAVDIVLLGIGDIGGLGIMEDEICIGAPTSPAAAVALHGPSHGVAVGLVSLDDIAACHLRVLVAGFVHLLNVDAAFVGLDFLHEDIKPLIVAVDDHLTLLPARSILPDVNVAVLSQ